MAGLYEHQIEEPDHKTRIRLPICVELGFPSSDQNSMIRYKIASPLRDTGSLETKKKKKINKFKRDIRRTGNCRKREKEKGKYSYTKLEGCLEFCLNFQ